MTKKPTTPTNLRASGAGPPDAAPGLLAIGAFSQLTRISPRMLRHYDREGILRPAAVNDTTGYRYYGLHQLAEAVTIRQWRDIGLPVSTIASLAGATDPTIRAALTAHRATLQQQHDTITSQLGLVDQLLTPTQEDAMTTIETCTVPAMTVVSLRATIDNYAAEGTLWKRLMPAVVAAAVTPTGDPCGATYHDEGYQDSDVDIEIWYPINGDPTPQPPAANTQAGGQSGDDGAQHRAAQALAADGLVVKRLPETTVVSETVTGPYAEAIPRGYQAIGGFLETHAVEGAGASFVRYLNSIQDVAPEECVTQVCLPIASN